MTGKWAGQAAYDARRYAADPEKYKARSRKYKNENKRKVNARLRAARALNRGPRRAAALLKLYGLTDTELQVIVLRSEGRCNLCEQCFSSSGNTHIDHCHETGRVRGLLCQRCNTALGTLGDTPDALRHAITYMEGALCSTSQH